MKLLQVPEQPKMQYTSARIPPGRYGLSVAKRKVDDPMCWDVGRDGLGTEVLPRADWLRKIEIEQLWGSCLLFTSVFLLIAISNN